MSAVKKTKGPPPDVVISSYDKARLLELLGKDPNAAGAASAADLRAEVERGSEVRPEDVPPDVVTMNTRVRVRDAGSGAVHTFTIVFPSDANPAKGKVSILDALAVALIGCRVGEVVTLSEGGVERQFAIEEILYQPEAAGDYHL
jgi:regulator of nucleoside diphosphate kinase